MKARSVASIDGKRRTRPTINAFPLEYCLPALLSVREVDENSGDALAGLRAEQLGVKRVVMRVVVLQVLVPQDVKCLCMDWGWVSCYFFGVDKPHIYCMGNG